MATFRDETGRTWRVVVDVPAIEAVRELYGLDLADDAAPELIVGLDVVELVEVLGVVLVDEIERAGCSEREFAGRIRGDVIEDAGRALISSTVEFFPEITTKTKELRDKQAAAELDPVAVCYRLAGAVGIWPGRGVTARKLFKMWHGRKFLGELNQVLSEAFGPDKVESTTDPRVLM